LVRMLVNLRQLYLIQISVIVGKGATNA
jgi:hypothetical protein